MGTPKRRVGRRSKIYDSINETKCPACGEWVATPIFASHKELEHPDLTASAFAQMEVRVIPVPEKIVELVQAGNYLETAAGAAGVGRNTFQSWMNWGEEYEGKEEAEVPADRRIYWAFRVAILHAREVATAKILRKIERAAIDDWRAAAWLLERTRGTAYINKERIQHSRDPDSPPLATSTVVVLTVEERLAEATEILGEIGLLPTGHSQNGSGPSQNGASG